MTLDGRVGRRFGAYDGERERETEREQERVHRIANAKGETERGIEMQRHVRCNAKVEDGAGEGQSFEDCPWRKPGAMRAATLDLA